MTQLPPFSEKKPASGTARERILLAAAEVFAQQGLMAATTREIAQAAQVNEVTIFRQFQSKQNLLAAVIQRVFAKAPTEPRKSPASLHEIVAEFARGYDARLSRDVRLIRVLIGEIQHCDEHAREVVRGVFHPQRQEFIDQLKAAQERGWVRPEADPAFIADQLGGMIFTNILKRDMPHGRQYSATKYLDSCVETITRAYAETPAGSEKRAGR